MSFVVSLENFEGPFDLLLQLIEQKHLDITDLSLSKVTEDYLAALETLKLSLEEMNWFLYVATRLVLAKSQRLLQLQTEPEDSSLQDLTESLKHYQALKRQAGKLKDLAACPSFARSGAMTQETKLSIDPGALSQAWVAALTAHQHQSKRISVKSRSAAIAGIRKKFLAELRLLRSFQIQDTVTSAPNRAQAVVYFTTILELLRQQKIAVHGEQLTVVGVHI